MNGSTWQGHPTWIETSMMTLEEKRNRIWVELTAGNARLGILSWDEVRDLRDWLTAQLENRR